MSILLTMFTLDGIIMGADSRITKTQSVLQEKNKNLLLNNYAKTDNGEKVFLLKKTNVGISVCGIQKIENEPIKKFLDDFERQYVDQEESPESVAKKLLEIVKNNEETIFYVCGYSEGVQHIYKIVEGNIHRKNLDEEGNIIFSLAWDGQTEAITKLINSKPDFIINCADLPLKDGIDFTKFLIDTTINYERFNDSIQTCGGPIDILVLTKDDAFWHKHKIYRP